MRFDRTLPAAGAPRTLGVRIGYRRGFEQHLRVGMRRPLVHDRRGTLLHDPAAVQDDDAVGEVPNDRKVMGDEQVAQLKFTLQISEQVENLRLNRQIERAHGLVADDQTGPRHQSASDRDPLPLPTGEVSWVACGRLRSNAHVFEHLDNTFADHNARCPALGTEGLRKGLANRPSRVEGAVRVLKHDLKLSAELSPLAVPGVGYLGPVKCDSAVFDGRQPENRPSNRCLAGTGFTDQADRLASCDLEADIVHRTKRRPMTPDRELDGEVVDLQQRSRSRRAGRGVSSGSSHGVERSRS